LSLLCPSHRAFHQVRNTHADGACPVGRQRCQRPLIMISDDLAVKRVAQLMSLPLSCVRLWTQESKDPMLRLDAREWTTKADRAAAPAHDECQAFVHAGRDFAEHANRMLGVLVGMLVPREVRYRDLPHTVPARGAGLGRLCDDEFPVAELLSQARFALSGTKLPHLET
jgi:hypothetical protein